jgi:hypothetical protein
MTATRRDALKVASSSFINEQQKQHMFKNVNRLIIDIFLHTYTDAKKEQVEEKSFHHKSNSSFLYVHI